MVRIGALARAGAEEDTKRVAEALGFGYQALEKENVKETKPEPDDGSQTTRKKKASYQPQAILPLPFLFPLQLEIVEAVSDTVQPQVSALSTWQNEPNSAPALQPLANVRKLMQELDKRLTVRSKSLKPDLKKTVRLLAENKTFEKLPRKQRSRHPETLQIVFDRSRHLVPIWEDQLHILSLVQQMLPDTEFAVYIFNDQHDACRLIDEESRHSKTPRPEIGPLLVLGDLGSNRSVHSRVRRYWQRVGEQFFKAEVARVALHPGRTDVLPDRVRKLWSLLSWEGRQPLHKELDEERAAVEQLVTLASPAIRIEPGLLRALRRELLPETDNSVEIAFWRHKAVSSRSSVAASLFPKTAALYRIRFAQLPQPTQKKAVEIIRDWRWNLPDGIYFEELLDLSSTTKLYLERDNRFATDFAAARAYFTRITRTWQDKQGEEGLGMRAWLVRISERAGEAWQEKPLRDAVTEVIRRHDNNFNPPVSPDKIDRPDVNVELVDLRLSGEGIDVQVVGTSSSEASGSPLARLPSKNGVVELGAWRASDQIFEKDFWQAGHAPVWADDWGVDDFGPWAVFSIVGQDVQTSEDGRVISNNVVRECQVLRWIPPGQFLMGSPADEAGRWEDEGPQHERLIENGFWLFDTAVTQGLWQAVMENNPSEFKAADRPVETVSWDEAKEFIDRLNKNLPGLDLDLPSEAEWEFACRADTADATYAGALSIDNEKSDHAVLDKIAWYLENSDNGTSPVALKEANSLGLYDMLGNVWEWCADEWHESYDGAPTDGTAWHGQASKQDSGGRVGRVVRGGSWSLDARGVRSAYRSRLGPSDRVNDLGFRCAVRSGELRQEARSAASRLSRPVTRGRSRVEQDGALPALAFASEIDLEQPKPKRVVVDNNRPLNTLELSELPRRRMRIRTDKAVLTLEPMTKPDWANAFGRDRFGLYADLKVENVTQKLRWIPPGGFLMGSPEGEPGRYEYESPQHYVTIGAGFWLFNTPVTQDLWEAVMGDNPSEYVHPDRPVERIDWDQAQSFATALSDRVPALMFELPSESEWEYACRAGTANATYAGSTKIVGERNAPALDEIAWYGGNSGQEFDLETGYDTSGWKEKQYPDDIKAGTRIVGLKKPNPFGLLDMLGNVWEWCADEWHDSYDGAPENGAVWHGQASQDERGGRVGRVVRGGSWYSDARSVRSACRYRVEPSDRSSDLGFRCAVRSVELGLVARSAGTQEAGMARDARAQPRGSGQTRAGWERLSDVAKLSDVTRLSDIGDSETDKRYEDNPDRGKS